MLPPKPSKVALAVEEAMNPLAEDFRKFLWAIWKHLNMPDPTPIQYDIALFLQHGPKRSIIEAFRGVGKSWITAAYVLWELYRNPQTKIMVVSASKDRADAFSSFCKRLIHDVPWLSHLQAQNGQRDSLIAFDVGPATPDQSPSVKSVGITGQLTGSRADIIVADDIEVLNNSATQTARDKLAELVKEFDAILKPLPTSRIIYLGTPQTEMSIYNQLPARGYVMRVWPAEIPENPETYKGALAPIIYARCEAGEPPRTPTDPQRFDEGDLAERRLSYGKGGYALQFMLDTSLSDANKYPLKLHDLIVQPVHREQAPTEVFWCNDPDKRLPLEAVGLAGDYYYGPLFSARSMVEYTGRVMAIDPSGRGSDQTTYAVGYFLNGNIFVPEWRGLEGGYDETTMKSLAMVARKHQVNKIIVESNFGDGMFTELLKPHLNRIYPCNIEEVRHNTQKELRIIDTLEPVMMQHRLVFDPSVVEYDYQQNNGKLDYSGFYQMARLTKERGALRHDDLIDVLAIMVAYWNAYMAADQKKLEQERQAELLEEELRLFDIAAADPEAFAREYMMVNGRIVPVGGDSQSVNWLG